MAAILNYMSNKKAKHPKMDPYLISNVKYEIDYVVSWAHKQGLVKVNSKIVRAVVKKIGRSRRKVYNYLKKNFA